MITKVWRNKSNNQLFVTVPKKAGLKEDDYVEIKPKSIQTVVYSFVCADLFHFGHLRILKRAKELGDVHICGVLTKKAIESYKRAPVVPYEERAQLIAHLDLVDMVIPQRERNPTNNLKYIHEELFPNAKIIMIHGTDWKEKPFPGEPYLKKIKGELVLHPYYKQISTTTIIKEIKERLKRGETI